MTIINEFQRKINGNLVLSESQIKQLADIDHAYENKQIKLNKKSIPLENIVNEKLEIYKGLFKQILDSCAQYGITFNYHQKNQIRHALYSKNKKLLFELGSAYPQYKEIIKNILEKNTLFENENYLEALNFELNRLDSMEKRQSLLSSIFARFVFEYFDRYDLYRYFSGYRSSDEQSYFEFLNEVYPEKFEERLSLLFIDLDKKYDYETTRDSVVKVLKRKFDDLTNYSYLAIKIPHSEFQWDLYSDFVLYAEKHREISLKSGYFHPKKIEKLTSNYIRDLDVNKAEFDISNEGYSYIDCFVTSKSNTKETNNNPYDLLLIFQKCEKDEDVIPCPACRSFDVRGNSYPKINVKSWECQNPLCPDKSKSNRGKRYSLESLIKQNGILNEDNKIEKELLRKWRNDILTVENDGEIVDMLIKFFSVVGDSVEIITSNSKQETISILNRKVELLPLTVENNELYKDFINSALFKRFIVEKKSYSNMKAKEYFVGKAEIFSGDSFDVLSQMNPNSIDSAITSPPYYNAKSYSNWDNIYNYLYDMYNINKELYKVLKPGSIYLYNIFDYFDNENSLVFSAMGKKRMILGAYMILIFRKIGFNVKGNIIWNKGEIEGKRNFNQGNDYPYYQTPFNAWEHIFVLTKENSNSETEDILRNLPSILYQKPVFKMKNGVNTAKHEAPFPEELPEMLIKLYNENSKIIDPFAGSFTTAVVAERHHVESINIEYKEEYCRLGIERLEKSKNQIDLFSSSLLD